jgi:FKBP-type peptidyl-prolyl cis-trans isomerase
MRKLAIVVALSLGVFGCEKKVSLDSDVAKGSYAIGQNIGHGVKGQGFKPDPDALALGISDAVTDKPSRITEDQMRAAMGKIQEVAMNSAREGGEKNLKEGQAYLEANKSKEGWKTTASGLQYKVVKEGSGTSPKDQDTVKTHYTGTLINGEKFDSSVDRGQPLEIQINRVIPGWTEGLKLMKPGGKMQFAIPANLAYGEHGQGKIGPNSVLLFDVELLEVEPSGGASKAPIAKKKK